MYSVCVTPKTGVGRREISKHDSKSEAVRIAVEVAINQGAKTLVLDYRGNSVAGFDGTSGGLKGDRHPMLGKRVGLSVIDRDLFWGDVIHIDAAGIVVRLDGPVPNPVRMFPWHRVDNVIDVTE